MDPQQHCRRICRQSRSNFVKTFYVLPRHRRHGFEAFYAFCRLVDDAVDEAPTNDEARRQLDFWSNEIECLYADRPTHPVAAALAPVVKRFAIPRDYLDAILAGCRMDLEQMSYQSFEDLKKYCYRVASCVGLVCLHLFEVPLTVPTKQAAIDLGFAVQLTNIIRDIRPDLQRGRVYLPQEDLQLFNVPTEQLSEQHPSSARIIELIRFEMARARNFYDQAWQGFPNEGREKRQLIAATLMGKIYEKLHAKIVADPIRVLQEKISLTTWQKLGITREVFAGAYL